jgi:DNA (cytosine-5)-methyltransferase 1
MRVGSLFSGIGGIDLGFQQAGFDIVWANEFDKDAATTYRRNFGTEHLVEGDITKVDESTIPNHDILCAGFPCQAFSAAGKRLGFEDTRGTMFFEVERIMQEKQPKAFILENVEGLVNHDRENSKDPIGSTLRIILEHLHALGYKVSWTVLNAKYFGVPQDRKRIYIVGTKKEAPALDNFKITNSCLKDILESGLEVSNHPFVELVLSHYKVEELYGKSIKDKRGGSNNIHSWDIDYKGVISSKEKDFMNLMLKERRKKKWAEDYGIDWMDGMPLTLE